MIEVINLNPNEYAVRHHGGRISVRSYGSESRWRIHSGILADVAADLDAGILIHVRAPNTLAAVISSNESGWKDYVSSTEPWESQYLGCADGSAMYFPSDRDSIEAVAMGIRFDSPSHSRIFSEQKEVLESTKSESDIEKFVQQNSLLEVLTSDGVDEWLTVRVPVGPASFETSNALFAAFARLNRVLTP